MHKRYEYNRQWRRENRERHNKLCREWRRAHPEFWKSYYQKNKEHISARSKKRYQENKEYWKEYAENNRDKIKLKMSKWQKENKEVVNARNKAYAAQKLRAIPGWANQEAVLCYYEFASLKSKITGEKWEVDHIIPLRSKLVCGLHTDYNLQVIKKADNLSKRNYHWPEMP